MPMDSLSLKIASLSLKVRKSALDSAKQELMNSSARSKKKNIFKRFANAVTNRNDAEEAVRAVEDISKDSTRMEAKDTLMIHELVGQTRQHYSKHISAIGNRVQSAVMADQYLSFQITELLMSLYNQIVNSRMKEIDSDSFSVDRNNTKALWVAALALILVLACIVLIFRNANKGYRARLALDEANEKNKSLLKTRHKLLLSVSHDVKTPLSSILGYAELYKQRGKLTDDDLLPIVRSGNHILALLNNLLEFSSLERGSLSLIPHDFLLVELSEELCEMFAPLAEKKMLAFRLVNNTETGLVLHSDYLKIKQILVNLLSNSMKYTAAGDVSLEISFLDRKLTFVLKDTGVGIPPEKRKLLFQPFVRIKENSAMEEGSGFGLFVVKGLVELFGGEIDVCSEINKGTHIRVVLPVEVGQKQPDVGPKRILLIDDDELLLGVTSDFCRRLGHEVVQCSSLEQFERELSDVSQYDFVLTDMEMARFTGEDVLAKIRQESPRTPVVLITGQGNIEKENVLQAGFADCLQKPVLINALRSIVGGRVLREMDGRLAEEMLCPSSSEIGISVLEGFLTATVENIVLLRKYLDIRDFRSIRFIAHRMLPTFLQVGAPDNITCVLKKLDSLKDAARYPMADDPLWEELEKVVQKIEAYLAELQDSYLAED
jgi:signal transduction histidine kinase/DNA-binding NarL/FixJ family response regulator